MCDIVKLKELRSTHFLCDDMSVTKLRDKTFSKHAGSGDQEHQQEHQQEQEQDYPIKHHPCYGYSQLYYRKDPFFYVTTPPMKCLFGVQKSFTTTFTMSLQFTDKTEDPEMQQFFEFIQNTEFECMKSLGLDETDPGRFISQIKYDAKGRYEPNLSVKIPFRYNRFDTDIYSDTIPIVNILSIPSFKMIQCDIYLDKMWKTNDRFCAKWKTKCIHLL